MFMKLEGHYLESTRAGLSVGAVAMQIRLSDGTDVNLPVPFVSIGGNLAVCPQIAVDGDSGLRIDFTRWSPLRYGTDATVRFPVDIRPQSLAIRVARAFDADPSTSWHDQPADMLAWLRTWGPANGLNVPGEGEL
jgi:hypothetical protein